MGGRKRATFFLSEDSVSGKKNQNKIKATNNNNNMTTTTTTRDWSLNEKYHFDSLSENLLNTNCEFLNFFRSIG